jgi:putative membrane protein
MNRITIALSVSAVLALAGCKNNASSADTRSATAGENGTAVQTANVAEGSQASGVDKEFVTGGIKGDTAELAIAQLAVSRGASQGVRDFGKMLLSDHTAHKQSLIRLAESANIAVPSEPADSGRAQLESLQKLSGGAFDKALLDTLIGNHKKGIAKNEAQAKTGDPQTAQLAETTVPVLKKHLATAEKLAGKL